MAFTQYEFLKRCNPFSLQGENEREYVYVLDLSKMYTSECIGCVAAQPTIQQLAMEDLRKIYKKKRKKWQLKNGN